MFYPAKFAPDADGGYTVTFRDVPEAITQGDDLDDAREAAADALLTAMDFYFEDSRQVPMPSKPTDGELLVELPMSAWTKVLLLNAMVEDRVRPTDLAKAMHVQRQEVNRILDLHHTTKIDTLVAAFRATGRDLQVTPVRM